MEEAAGEECVDVECRATCRRRVMPAVRLAKSMQVERSTIHLDMIFTIVNYEQAVVYSPYILEKHRARVIRIRVNADGNKKFKEVDDLLLGLRSVGVRMDPILCGGYDTLHQQREQNEVFVHMICCRSQCRQEPSELMQVW